MIHYAPWFSVLQHPAKKYEPTAATRDPVKCLEGFLLWYVILCTGMGQPITQPFQLIRILSEKKNKTLILFMLLTPNVRQCGLSQTLPDSPSYRLSSWIL